jgi:hypothetical protein
MKQINKISILMTALIISSMLSTTLVHEFINWAIFARYGISSTICFGLIHITNDYWTGANDITTWAWTTANSTEYYKLGISNPPAYISMIQTLRMNENGLSQVMQSLSFALPSALIGLYFIFKIDRKEIR